MNPPPVTDGSGKFTATLKLEPGAFRPGQTQWLIAASPGEGPVPATAAQVRVPATGAGLAPGAPPTGNSGSTNTDALPFGAIILAALGLAAASASVLGVAAARRR